MDRPRSDSQNVPVATAENIATKTRDTTETGETEDRGRDQDRAHPRVQTLDPTRQRNTQRLHHPSRRNSTTNNP